MEIDVTVRGASTGESGIYINDSNEHTALFALMPNLHFRCFQPISDTCGNRRTTWLNSLAGIGG
jgi:hypothetical protein